MIGGSPNKRKMGDDARRKSTLNIVNNKNKLPVNKVAKRGSILDPTGGFLSTTLANKVLKIEKSGDYEDQSKSATHKKSLSKGKFSTDGRDAWLHKN